MYKTITRKSTNKNLTIQYVQTLQIENYKWMGLQMPSQN